MTILSFLIRNPLAVIFGLFILAIITYFFFEIFAENKRIQKHYTLRNIIWGVILIVLALVSLFTPALGYIVTAVYDGRPQLQLIYFLDKTCDNSTETNTFFENTFDKPWSHHLQKTRSYRCFLLYLRYF